MPNEELMHLDASEAGDAFDFLIKASGLHEIFHIYIFLLERCCHHMVDKFALCGDIHSHATRYQMSSTIKFREFTAALFGPVHFLSSDQQSGIHCLIICAFQLLTMNNLGGI